MATQIIALSPHVLDAVLDTPAFNRRVAFGARDMETKIGKLPDGRRVLCIEIDRLVFYPEIPNKLSDDIYALAVAAEPISPDLTLPISLPEPLVLHLLDEVAAAISEYPQLSGHDRLEVMSAICHAKTSAPRPLVSCRRMPADSDGAVHLEQGYALQAQLGPALASLDDRLTAYGDELRNHRLEAAVVRLGFQADLGALLKLKSVKGELVPQLSGKHRRGGFRELWQSTQNSLAAFQYCLDRIHDASVQGANWLEDDSLLPLHGTLLHQLVPAFACGRYRSEHMRIRSMRDGTIHAPELPAEAVDRALEAFVRAFDADLWRDRPALLRAGLAHVELMRIHPFGDGNGRLGRLLLQAMLIEDGVPGLPLEAVLTWNRDAYLTAVDGAVRKADLLGFMQFLLRAVNKAIDLGRYFVRELSTDRTLLLDAFRGGGSRFAMVAAEYAGSMLLGPDLQLVKRAMNAQDLHYFLREAGFDPVPCKVLELAGYRIDTLWSFPVARDLLMAPPARFQPA